MFCLHCIPFLYSGSIHPLEVSSSLCLFVSCSPLPVSQVYLARHKQTGQSYAIKVLQKKAIIRRNEVKHIMAERNVLLKNTTHPFLVGLHYSFQTNSKLYFVLDYVNGGELFFHLQRERVFEEPRARWVGPCILKSVE